MVLEVEVFEASEMNRLRVRERRSFNEDDELKSTKPGAAARCSTYNECRHAHTTLSDFSEDRVGFPGLLAPRHPSPQ